jgi:hypothetical protein
LWLIKVWFSAPTFVVKIVTFAKPETVMGKLNKNKNQRRSAKANGLTTQCEKKIV